MINQYIKKWLIAFVLSGVCLIGLSSMHNTTFAKDIDQIENEYNTKVGIYGINTENGKVYEFDVSLHGIGNLEKEGDRGRLCPAECSLFSIPFFRPYCNLRK